MRPIVPIKTVQVEHTYSPSAINSRHFFYKYSSPISRLYLEFNCKANAQFYDFEHPVIHLKMITIVVISKKITIIFIAKMITIDYIS